jgi:peptide/nickel transport system permease protein
MGSFLIQRLFQTVIVVVIVSIIVFLAMRILPGDPILVYIEPDQLYQYSQADLDALRKELGLDRNIAIQYLDWVGGVLQGDFGTSPTYNRPVLEIISQRLPVTMYLGLIAFVMHLLLGIPLGIIAAVKRGKWQDILATFTANLGITIPIFWLGILLVYLFGINLKWLPTFGYTSPLDDFGLNIRQAIMPVICLSIFGMAATARQTRAALLEVIQQDYIRTAWSKGLAERSVIFTHALKNSLIPVITLQGFAIKSLIGGSVLVETVFNIPGMGRLAADAMLAKDFAVVQGVILLIAIIVCLANLLVEIIYGWIDPRIRLS